MLGMQMRGELERALRLDPDHVPARIELVRYLVHAPSFAGGGFDAARAQAAEVAKREAAAGHFARGYIAYREHQFGVGRTELRAAIETSKRADLTAESLMWLGWLSQESQQWDEAFASWERLIRDDPKRIDALYEIGRTASFCRCETGRGEKALTEYLKRASTTQREAAKRLLLKLREPQGSVSSGRK
jgi:tetratricopeptide (TPR) repeat protein